jgi:hypothetical protein
VREVWRLDHQIGEQNDLFAKAKDIHNLEILAAKIGPSMSAPSFFPES